jgi:hypothetical protein
MFLCPLGLAGSLLLAVAVPALAQQGTAEIADTSVNAMQNVAFDGRRNGPRGADYFQIDLRASWHHAVGRGKALDLFVDIFNLTNRTNFDNPGVTNRDAGVPTTFLVLRNLYGGSGFPHQALLGARFSF